MLTTLAILFVGGVIAWQARRRMTFAVIALQLFLLVVVSLGAWQLESRQDELAETQDAIVDTQEQLQTERLVRSRVQGEINRYVCTENNNQDRILAGLIEVSVGGSAAFGKGIDRSLLSPFDREVLSSITKVQRLTEGQGDELKSAFRRALRELQAETPCAAVVKAFLAASTTDDLKAIRRILRDASKDTLRPDRHSPK